MSDNTDLIRQFLKQYPNCPDPEIFPRVVEYLVRLFLYDRKINENSKV